MPGEAGRQGGLEVDGFAGDGVMEVQEVGVEEVAAVAGEAGEGFQGVAGGTVEGVADQGMAEGGQVDSDLMRAAGVEGDRKGGGGCGAVDDLGEGL
jgi:hypothetical protein